MDYPNLFDIVVDVDDSDDDIVNKIRSALTLAQGRLVPAVTFSTNHRWSRLVQTATPPVNLADTLLANDSIKAGLIDALRWKSLDVEMKYSHIFETALQPKKF